MKVKKIDRFMNYINRIIITGIFHIMLIVDLCYIGSKIREVRKKKNLTRAKLAEMVGRSTTHIGLIKRGKRISGLEAFMDILENVGK